MVTSNPFANYTLSIATQYNDTQIALEKTKNKPRKKIYKSLDKLLEECFFMGATKFGTNFIA